MSDYSLARPASRWSRRPAPVSLMTRAGSPGPSARGCAADGETDGENDGETDGHGFSVGEAPNRRAIRWRWAGRMLGALGLLEPVPAEPVLAEPVPGEAEAGALLSAALPGVTVVPEPGSLGEVSLTEGDGVVEPDGAGLVDEAGGLLDVGGAELLVLPGVGVMLALGEPLTG